jgi:hypothetical protein
MRRYLIPTLFLFVACSPLRHYQKVVNDPFRNAKERALLARAAQQEFPNVSSDTQQVSVVVDSSEVNLLNEEYNHLLDAYLDHLNSDTSQISKREIDTVLIEKIKALKPATITKTITKEIKVRDGVWAEVKQNEVSTCREELRLMTFQKDELKTKSNNKSKIILYMGLAWIALLAIVIWKPRIPKIF